MTDILTSWWDLVAAYFAAPLDLLAGKVEILTILPTVGIVLGLIGLALAIVWREKKAIWLIPPFILTAMAPLVIAFSKYMMAWFGMSFVMVAGLVCLLIWVSVIARDSIHRLPIWLLGLSFLSFIAYCGAILVVIATWL